MRQQVIAFHGGDAFDSYEEFLQNLIATQIDFTKLGKKGWKDTLQEKLGENFHVMLPRMPNAANAKYIEWKIWFEKFFPLINDDVIFIGHSLGGIFLAKYLSENIFPKKIKAVFLIAAPYNTKDTHPLADFNLENSLEQLQKQAGELFLYQSKDDNVVPYSNFTDYKNCLAHATERVFEDRGHFNQEELNELITDIKALK